MAESNSQGQKQGQGRNEAMETVAPQAPVTLERKVLEDLDEKLPKPYLPRALVAADTEHPSGTWGHQHFSTLVFSNSMMPSLTWTMMALFPAYRLQFHIFFHLDRSDQRILKSPHTDWVDTFSIFSNIYFREKREFARRNRWKVNSAWHELVFDRGGSLPGGTGGRFVPSNIENIFSKYALTEPDKLTFTEVGEQAGVGSPLHTCQG
ncbi:hypothetical protein AAC387_Pa12g1762 [Persea americana]